MLVEAAEWRRLSRSGGLGNICLVESSCQSCVFIIIFLAFTSLPAAETILEAKLANEMAEANPFAQLFSNKPSTTVHLAVLHPGSGKDDIQVGITNTDPTATSYDCISYDRSGQSDMDNVSIKVAGEPTDISRHLETALLQLRDRNTARILWADLLAGNTVEKRSTQAATTKVVISNADKVIIWLGPGNKQSAVAFDIIQIMANRWQQACLHTGFPRNLARATAQQMIGLQQHLFSKPPDDLQGTNKDAWKEIERLLTSSYFKSAQAIPEVLLAKKIVVRCGTSTMDYHDLVRSSRAIIFFMARQLELPVSEELMKAMALVHSLDTAQRRKSEGETLELLPMIHSARKCSTSDPREIVFSMLPIINPSARQPDKTKAEPPPVADYSKSVIEVFVDAARYIVHERQDLLLWWNESPPRRRKIPGLPSWVPDWTSPLPEGTVKLMNLDNTNGLRAWWDQIDPALRKRIKVANNTLTVQAHVLDRVEHVSEMFTAENCRRLCLTLFQQMQSRPNETVEAKSQRVSRTILLNQAGVGDSLRETAVPPEDMWMSFQSLIAEERILELLNCTAQELMARPEILQRTTDPQIGIMGPLTGRSQAFEALLRQNALGRCYFTTKNGRSGMTALQTLPPGQEGDHPVPDFAGPMADPLGRSLIEMFQVHLRERQPEAAGALANALAGKLPGQAPQGVRSGDLVVALVGGWQPYVLRPQGEFAQTEADCSEYEYVGDCYLHGVMDGEPFKNTSGAFHRDVKLVDIVMT